VSNWQSKLPWIQAFYAIKSNPIFPLLNDLYIILINFTRSAKENVGFDCASKTEIKIALELGTQPKDIVYSNPVKLV
jgi:diaminopimelate decarboxylase